MKRYIPATRDFYSILIFVFFMLIRPAAGETKAPDDKLRPYQAPEFTIESAYSGYVADMNTKKPGLLVVLWDLLGGPHQRLRAIPTDDGYYILQFIGAGGLCLDINDKGLVAGRERSGGDSQKWRFERGAGRRFRIVSFLTGKALDIVDRNNKPGACLTLKAADGGASQEWLINPTIVLTGKVMLPAGVTAPEDGLRVDLKALDVGGEIRTVVIPRGENAAAFRMELPYSTKTVYRLKYLYWGAGYARCGYWTKNGTRAWGSKAPDWRIISGGGDVADIGVTLLADGSVHSQEEENRIAEKKAGDIVRDIIKPGMTDFEKTLAVYDYIADHFRFFNEADPEGNNIRALEDIWNPYGILVLQCTTCEGYSWAMDRLLTLAGVQTKRINNWHHAWNLVSIEGNYYHVDSVASANYGEFLKTTAEVRDNPDAIQHDIECAIADRPFVFRAGMYPHKEWLSSRAYRRIIGRLALPSGMVSPPGGLNIRINNVNFHILPGEKEISFMLKESLGDAKAKNGIVIRYYTADPRIQSGFYAGEKSVVEESGALKIMPGAEDITGIRISMLKKEITPITLYNPLTKRYLYEKDNRVFCGAGDIRNNVWFLEDAGGYVRIRNLKTGHYLHIENRKNTVECDGAPREGWWSAQWTIRKDERGYGFIVNRWQPERIAVTGGSPDVLHPPTENSAPDECRWLIQPGDGRADPGNR